MITSYELKNRRCCRFFYKIPYFIKNLFLLLLLASILIPIYFAHFRKESIGFENVQKVFMGLNSKTFNFLQQHAKELNVKETLKRQKYLGLTIKKFYTECVSYSRACYIEGGAKEWAAIQKWKYENQGQEYLANKIMDTNVFVYVDPDATNNHEDFSGFSFKPDTKELMSYRSEFLKQMSKNPVGMTLRHAATELENKLASDMIYPPYYHEYGEFDRMEFTQA